MRWAVSSNQLFHFRFICEPFRPPWPSRLHSSVGSFCVLIIVFQEVVSSKALTRNKIRWNSEYVTIIVSVWTDVSWLLIFHPTEQQLAGCYCLTRFIEINKMSVWSFCMSLSLSVCLSVNESFCDCLCEGLCMWLPVFQLLVSDCSSV